MHTLSRRQWLKLMALTPFMLNSLPNKTSAQQSPPNVLFIIFDDLNSWISILGGHPDVKTPNFERLAKRGVVFKNAYAPGPVCNVSRTAMLSGLYPHKTGVYSNGVDITASEVLQKSGFLPTYFQQNGYRVLCGGKVFHSPMPELWDENYLTLYEEVTRGLDVGWSRNRDRMFQDINVSASKDWGVPDYTEEDYADTKIAAWASDQLNKDTAQPLFLALGFRRPHGPFYVPQKYFDLYPSAHLPVVQPDDLADVPEFAIRDAKSFRVLTESGLWEEGIKAYLACISFADARLGQVLDGLEQSPHNDNTLIVVTSDHGYMWGEKDRWGKGQLWEESLQVPLIIAGLEGMAQNVVCESPVNLIDIYSTLIDLCQLPARTELDGQSLTPLLQDPNQVWTTPVLSEMGHRNFTLRTKDWRYTRYVDGSEELYDHQNDPHEWTNLAEDTAYDSVKLELSQYIPATIVPPITSKHDNAEPEDD